MCTGLIPVSLFTIVGHIWIGGYDFFLNDTMYWLDDTPIEDGYTNWAPNEPDGGAQNCLYLRFSESWEWADNPESEDQYALCEIEQ